MKTNLQAYYSSHSFFNFTFSLKEMPIKLDWHLFKTLLIKKIILPSGNNFSMCCDLNKQQ